MKKQPLIRTTQIHESFKFHGDLGEELHYLYLHPDVIFLVGGPPEFSYLLPLLFLHQLKNRAKLTAGRDERIFVRNPSSEDIREHAKMCCLKIPNEYLHSLLRLTTILSCI